MDYIARGTSALKSALDMFGLGYGHDGVMANINAWAENKRRLIDTLRKHPNWNEDALAVVMNITERRGGDDHATVSAICSLSTYLEYDKRLPDLSRIVDSLEMHLRQKNITQDCVDAANALVTMPPVMPSVGMKTSRFIRKLCESYGLDVDGDTGFRTRFATFADSVSPLEVTRPILFSVNPADYALMSNGNSWTSCQRIGSFDGDGGGEYMAGAFSYMNDGATVVAYTVESLPEDMTKVCLMPKYSRHLFYLASDGEMFIQSRSYPSASRETRREVRKIMHSILSQVYGFDNMWGPPTRGNNRYTMQMDDMHYPDYRCFSDSTTLSYLAVHKEEVQSDSYSETIEIGSQTYCIVCGRFPMHSCGSLYCQRHADEDDDEDDDYEDEYDPTQERVFYTDLWQSIMRNGGAEATAATE